MNQDTQNIIIKMLGCVAIVTIIELIPLLVFIPSIDTTIIVALVNIPTLVASGLVGFLTGKTLSEKQEEVINAEENFRGEKE